MQESRYPRSSHSRTESMQTENNVSIPNDVSELQPPENEEHWCPSVPQKTSINEYSDFGMIEASSYEPARDPNFDWAVVRVGHKPQYDSSMLEAVEMHPEKQHKATDGSLAWGLPRRVVIRSGL